MSARAGPKPATHSMAVYNPIHLVFVCITGLLPFLIVCFFSGFAFCFGSGLSLSFRRWLRASFPPEFPAAPEDSP